MNKKKYGLLTGTAALALILAACGGTDTNTDKSAAEISKESGETKAIDFETVVENEGDVIDGGTLQVALVTDSPFQGIFSQELYEDNYDANLMEFALESLFSTDDNFMISNDGAATLDFDQDAKTATITLKDGVTWSDGEPVTAEDMLYSYEVIGNKDYTGIRYDSTFTNIVGMEEYHNGETETISGITVEDDQTIKVEYLTVSPTILQAGGGIWSSAMPKHQLKDVAIADLVSSPEIRENPIGFGPFKVENIVPGESVEYSANEHYYKGKPQLDNVIVEVVPASSIVASLESGKYDLALSMPTDTYDSYKDLAGYTLLGREELSYTYVGFKLGAWDSEKGEVIPDPDAKMANKSLRQAMAYALDNDAVGQKFYSGLRSGANSLIPPVFADVHDADLEGYTYDTDKANKLLDDAGYKDVDGDDIREDPEGEKLTINFASMAGGEIAEPLAEYYMQSWQQIGLDVELTDGRLLEFNSFYDRVQADDKEIDIYQAAWGTGTDPTPSGLYGRTAEFNLARYATEEHDELLAAIESEDAWDLDYKVDAFHKWQEFISDEAPVIPTLFRNEILPVNNRVKNYDWTYGSNFGWNTIGVTADAPLKK
ncbi:oligopeptide ABC transporter substrate-binding protein [Carnobacterium sp. CS13]|uniref:oligopeptide ABC transporter substrate-binding protein n=1 Tax=Carnobacterium sp. CS13 TaxID=2800128 RepID=UPI0019127A36|nr:oligopeptide ABC transporter substrate-binding protein [Carnobacterium sp. CS13]QQP71109.1 oligopeptide ABC transporter substrate-binding protein [Carnobacterium sp. CS13]